MSALAPREILRGLLLAAETSVLVIGDALGAAIELLDRTPYHDPNDPPYPEAKPQEPHGPYTLADLEAMRGKGFQRNYFSRRMEVPPAVERIPDGFVRLAAEQMQPDIRDLPCQICYPRACQHPREHGPDAAELRSKLDGLLPPHHESCTPPVACHPDCERDAELRVRLDERAQAGYGEAFLDPIQDDESTRADADREPVEPVELRAATPAEYENRYGGPDDPAGLQPLDLLDFYRGKQAGLCAALSPVDRAGNRPYLCSRIAGHDGDHSAEGIEQDGSPWQETWPQ